MNKKELIDTIENICNENPKAIKYSIVRKLSAAAESYATSQTEALKKEIEVLKDKVEKLQYSEAMAGVHIYNLECERSLYKSIAEALSDDLKNDIDNLMDSCSINGEVEIVKEEDIDEENAQDENFGIFNDIMVEQWSVGDSGDSFNGFIYARIDHKEKKTWLKIPYNC